MNPPLRERLRWAGQEPTPADASADRAVMARSFMYLYGAGAAMAFLTLALPHASDRWAPGVALVGACAAAVALLTLVGFDRLPVWYFHALPALGTLHIGVITYSGGAGAFGAYAMYFTWVVLSSFYFLSRRLAVVNLVLVAVSYAFVIGLKGDLETPALNWIMLTGTLVVGGLLIGLLRDTVATTLRRLEATTEIALAISGDSDRDRVLGLIVERGRGLIEARALMILIADGAEMRVEAVAGERPEHPRSVLDVPLVFRGRSYGSLVALDRIGQGGVFTAADERLMRSFAASAAVAVANAQSVEEDRLRQRITAGEGERRRWARDLHDSTLQGLGGLRVMLASALSRDDPEQLERAGRESLDHIGAEIENLHSIIADLRPPALDTLGLGPALEGLAERIQSVHDVAVDADIRLPSAPGAESDLELETTAFRIVQEALTNVAKHARPRRVRLEVGDEGDWLEILVQDDGVGFDTARPRAGFGLSGMRERVALAGGSLELSSAPGRGTRVSARLPRQRELGLRLGEHVLEHAERPILRLPDGAVAATEDVGHLSRRVPEREAQNDHLSL